MDMIPSSYRAWLSQVSILRRWSLVLTGIVALGVLISVTFEELNTDYEREIAVLEKNKAITSQQRNVLQRLQGEYDTLSEKREMLLKLRGGAAAEEMFRNIDLAMEPQKLWFDKWEFMRAGERTDKEPDGVNTGYFIVIPADKVAQANSGKQETWKIKTHMKISGRALDHQALSSFVRKLLSQPQIQDVRVKNTRRNINVSGSMVDFNLIVIVDTGMSAA